MDDGKAGKIALLIVLLIMAAAVVVGVLGIVASSYCFDHC